MQCNRRECGETLAGQEFVVTVCGHAFCSACQVETLERACCEACGQGLTDDDVEVCSPIPRGNAGSLALCGHDVNTILAIAARAITFAEGQQQLRYARAQETSEDLARRNSKLSSALMEMQAKQVSALNVMQARVKALEQELEIERGQGASLHTKLQHESRQKRRLEDECAMLEQRRVHRNTFVANTLKPQPRVAIRNDAPGPPGHAPPARASQLPGSRAPSQQQNQSRSASAMSFQAGGKGGAVGGAPPSNSHQLLLPTYQVGGGTGPGLGGGPPRASSFSFSYQGGTPRGGGAIFGRPKTAEGGQNQPPPPQQKSQQQQQPQRTSQQQQQPQRTSQQQQQPQQNNQQPRDFR